MNRAWIGLGANLDDPPARIRMALERIGRLATVDAVSAFYRSRPMGPADQPDFCNAVCGVRTDLTAEALMQALLGIERELGRERGIKWGPRTIDLDLLHVDGERRDGPDLVLPHPGIAARNFVLAPWAEIAPELEVPGIGPLADAAERIGSAGLQRWYPEAAQVGGR